MIEAHHLPVESGAIRTREELPALEAQYKSLQTLVAELLLTNQNLRQEIARLRQIVWPSSSSRIDSAVEAGKE
jgi:hypothetical protein